MIYDAAVIGTGPAGISAALNLKIHGRKFLLLGSGELSGKLARAERVSNYPGFTDIPGEELRQAFCRQLEAMDIAVTEAMVNSILPFGGHYALMAGADYYEARTLILTTGVAAVGTMEGEERLLGRGVSYCATCDGNLYRGRVVGVLCTAARFEHEVRYLAEAAESVLYFPAYKNGASSWPENVTVMEGRPVAVLGEDRAEALRLNTGETVPVDGLFCLRDAIALSSLLPGLATEDGHIAVDRRMAANLPGVFAAGDCTGRPYQYAKAVGEGNVAAHSALAYLDGTAQIRPAR